MGQRIVALDFDNTATDGEKEAEPYVDACLKDLALLFRRMAQPRGLATMMGDATAKILANPDCYGWLYQGKVVAPAMVDPYIRMGVIIQIIFDNFGVFHNSVDRQTILDYFFAKNYPISAVAFKDGAAEMLRELCADDSLAVYIVTNSDTEAVCNKLAALAAGDDKLKKLCGRVVGNAGKYKLGPLPATVPESVRLDGLSRPVYLRRSAYYQVLDELRLRHRNDWSDMTVVGDIFELDLALPLALGARVGLAANQFTPRYELDYFAANPDRTRIITSLDQIPAFVRG